MLRSYLRFKVSTMGDNVFFFFLEDADTFVLDGFDIFNVHGLVSYQTIVSTKIILKL